LAEIQAQLQLQAQLQAQFQAQLQAQLQVQGQTTSDVEDTTITNTNDNVVSFLTINLPAAL
jgi:hypothetical protein